MRRIIVVCLVVVLAVLGTQQLSLSGCNSDEPFVVERSKVALKASPCGPRGLDPEWWEVTIDGETSFNAPASPANTQDGSFWLPLGDFYRLKPGNNKVEYRAFTYSSFAGMVKAATVDVINLVYNPPTPTPTPTPEVTPTPTPFVGQFTITEIVGGDE